MTTKERPILFKARMVNAIISGRKTQTRRVIKPQPPENRVIAKDPHGQWRAFHTRYSERRQTGWIPDAGGQIWRCPYGKPGDLLYVRETHQLDPPHDGTWDYYMFNDGGGQQNIEAIPDRFRNPDHVIYRATTNYDDLKWRPSIHLPKWASRLWLNVEEVRAEWLQEVGEEDARAEGIELIDTVALGPQWKWYGDWFEEHKQVTRDARWSFRTLWDSINADRGSSWESNPFVWVVKFSINHERSSLPTREEEQIELVTVFKDDLWPEEERDHENETTGRNAG